MLREQLLLLLLSGLITFSMESQGSVVVGRPDNPEAVFLSNPPKLRVTFHAEPVTLSEARTSCQQGGGDLISASNSVILAEAVKVIGPMTNAPVTSIWTLPPENITLQPGFGNITEITDLPPYANVTVADIDTYPYVCTSAGI